VAEGIFFAVVLYTILGLFVYLGATVHALFFIGCLTVFPLKWALDRIRHRRKYSNLLANVRQQWIAQSPSDVDFEWIEGQYYNWEEDDTGIDPYSWDELELNDVFLKANRTFTSLGDIALYSMLRTPLLKKESLQERGYLIRVLHENAEVREAMQMDLCKLGRSRQFRLEDLDNVIQMPSKSFRSATVILKSLVIISFLLLLILQNSITILAAIVIALLSLVFSTWFRLLFFWRGETFVYLGRAIACAESLAQLGQKSPLPHADELRELSELTREVCQKNRMFERDESNSTELTVLFGYYIRSFLLLDVSDYFRFIDLVSKHRLNIRKLLRLLGELDAFQSVISFRNRLPVFCEPEFTDEDKLILDCMGCQHPLLNSSVANSIFLEYSNAFITGSNTSGKSTFLRTIGLNAIMAQTIYTVSATAYKAPPFKILTSINSYDDLSESKSLFQMEAERLHNIIMTPNDFQQALCIVDEPLKGTNSLEAVCATIETLRYVSDKKMIALFSSHHTQIAQELPDNYKIFHFSAPTTEDPMKQNYLLQAGLEYRFNGIDTLERVGFPASIVDGARKRMKSMLGDE